MQHLEDELVIWFCVETLLVEVCSLSVSLALVVVVSLILKVRRNLCEGKSAQSSVPLRERANHWEVPRTAKTAAHRALGWIPQHPLRQAANA